MSVLAVMDGCANKGCCIIDSSKLKRCKTCKMASYCSKKCQGEDYYARHRDVCNPVPSIQAQPSILITEEDIKSTSAVGASTVNADTTAVAAMAVAETTKREVAADKAFLNANMHEIYSEWEKETKVHGRGIITCVPRTEFEKRYGTGPLFDAALAQHKMKKAGKHVITSFVPIARFASLGLTPAVHRWATNEHSRDDVFCSVVTSFEASGSTTFRLKRLAAGVFAIHDENT